MPPAPGPRTHTAEGVAFKTTLGDGGAGVNFAGGGAFACGNWPGGQLICCAVGQGEEQGAWAVDLLSIRNLDLLIPREL